MTTPVTVLRRRTALLALLPLALVSCSSQEPPHTPPPAEPTATAAPEPVTDLGIEDLDQKVSEIEKKTNTQVSFSLFDGTHSTNAGSGGALPAWSTIKVPIALTAWEHCDDKNFVLEQTTAAIEWSDNDAAYALFNCIGSPDEASRLVGEEIAASGVTVHVEHSFGTTTWPVPAQARYAQHLASVPADNPVIQEMHKIDAAHSYGLGTIADLPFKGGWSDARDGSYHVRQLGFFSVKDAASGGAAGSDFGVAIAARSILGSEQDCHDALNELAALLASSSLQLRLKNGPASASHGTPEETGEETGTGAHGPDANGGENGVGANSGVAGVPAN